MKRDRKIPKIKFLHARIPYIGSGVELADLLDKVPERMRSAWIYDACVQRMKRDALAEQEPTIRDVLARIDQLEFIISELGARGIVVDEKRPVEQRSATKRGALNMKKMVDG